ncbi:5'-3' exonuclease H3TH domain-containing protein [Longispora sp. NPDC051575]|uniref:5'-3' exonuclease n=1 Tax=Longispora sp. NPDC051575 TaxID=3154943 RepID=UPI003427CC09
MTSATIPAPLLVVDGMSMLFATLGYGSTLAPNGQPMVGTYGFFDMLRASIHGDLPAASELVVAFDGENSRAARQALYPPYKAHRVRRPEDEALLTAVPVIRRTLEQSGIAVYAMAGAEGDDQIASIVAGEKPDRRIAVWSRDRDLYALVTDRVLVLDAKRPRGERFVTERVVLAEYGVTPAQWTDYRALVGDSSDGIPGVTGIGEDTAARVLAGGFLLEDLPNSGRCTGRAKKIFEQWENALLFRDLIRLRRDLDVGYVSTGGPSPELPDVHRLHTEFGL